MTESLMTVFEADVVIAFSLGLTADRIADEHEVPTAKVLAAAKSVTGRLGHLRFDGIVAAARRTKESAAAAERELADIRSRVEGGYVPPLNDRDIAFLKAFRAAEGDVHEVGEALGIHWKSVESRLRSIALRFGYRRFDALLALNITDIIAAKGEV